MYRVWGQEVDGYPGGQGGNMSLLLWVWLALFVLLMIGVVIFVLGVMIAAIIGVVVGFWKAARHRR